MIKDHVSLGEDVDATWPGVDFALSLRRATSSILTRRKSCSRRSSSILRAASISAIFVVKSRRSASQARRLSERTLNSPYKKSKALATYPSQNKDSDVILPLFFWFDNREIQDRVYKRTKDAIRIGKSGFRDKKPLLQLSHRESHGTH